MTKKSLAAVILLLLALVAGSISAAPTLGGPALGLWGDPAEDGRGFHIDIQGGTMVVTTFIYTNTGAPIWYLSAGDYNHKTGVFESTYDSYSNGQCFGCRPGKPDLHAADAGPLKIQFHSNSRATATSPAGPLKIRKLDYGVNEETVLYGEWSFTMNVAGLYTADWILFDKPYVSSDGTKYASGYSDDRRREVALGRWVNDDIGHLILVTSGTNFYHAYQMNLEDQRGVGRAWVYRTNETISGSGAPAVASRLLYHGELSVPKNASAHRGVNLENESDEKLLDLIGDSGRPAPAVEEALLKMLDAIESRRSS